MLPIPATPRDQTAGPKDFDHFEQVMDPALYAPLPDDYVLGLTDVVGSTKAIEAGRYKAVNMAGAAAISAIRNALPNEELAFVFGGDGCSVAVPGRHAQTLRTALARTARWTQSELGLTLRVALVPVAAVRAAGHDVRVAWYHPSEFARYAMFSGGGLAFAEAEMKAGRYAIEPAALGEPPDLTGLSCRWKAADSRFGVILSLVMRPAAGASDAAFAKTVGETLALCGNLARGGHPIAEEGPQTAWPPPGIEYEARARRGQASLLWTRLKLYAHTLFAWALFYGNISVGRFNPTVYRSVTARNTDFRKFDDGLRMTLDCSVALADRIEALLAEARAKGSVDYGLFRQTQAILTCVVRSALENDHLHFVDGAMGGYAAAAMQMKAAMAR